MLRRSGETAKKFPSFSPLLPAIRPPLVGPGWPRGRLLLTEFMRALQARLRMLPAGFYLGAAVSSVDDRNRPRPARRGALDLDRKAGHHETGRRQKFQIVQLLDVA